MDFSSKSAVLRTFVPQIPSLVLAAIWHTLNLSPTSQKSDLRTELLVNFLRNVLGSPSPHGLLTSQLNSCRDPGIKGKMWISKVTIPTLPTNDVLALLCTAINDLKQSSSEENYSVPEYIEVEAEWTGYRAGVDAQRLRPDLSEQEHYARLMAETSTPVTILYLHGGALILMDPATHRAPVSKLARMTGGRAFNVRYRLAPQHPFPSALLDTLIAYLALLYPPPDAYHTAVKASHIVLAGDSAGGNLSVALIQLLLQINRGAAKSSPSSSFQFYHHTVSLPLPLPAGIALHSAWLDLTSAFPSKVDNLKYDYLPPPPLAANAQSANIPSDSIWPSKPPRGDLYCETSMLCHPLVSPVIAKDWHDGIGVKVYLSYGQETLVDEGKQLAQRMAQQGMHVQFEEWEGCCHCFGMIMVWTPTSRKFFEHWADFIRAAVNGENDAAATHGPPNGGTVGRKINSEAQGTFFTAKTLEARDLDVVNTLAIFEDGEAEERMRANMARRHLHPDDATKSLPKL